MDRYQRRYVVIQNIFVVLLLTISVLYYAPQIFGSLGLSSNTTSLLATGVVGIVLLLGTSLELVKRVTEY